MRRLLAAALLALLCGPAWAQEVIVPQEGRAIADPENLAPPRPVPLETSLPPSNPEVLRLNLTQTMSEVLGVSPSLEGIQAQIRQAEYRVQEAYTSAQPKVDFAAQYSRQEPPVAFPGGPVINPADNYRFTLTIRQAIWTFGRMRWNALANKLAKRSTQEQYRTEVNRLVFLTAQRYIEALLAQEGVLIAEDNLEAQLANLRTSQLLFEQGVAAKFDVLRNSAAAAQSQQELIEAKTSAKVARARVLSLLSQPLDRPLALEALDLSAPLEIDLIAAKQRALETRPELRSLRWAVEEARARIEVAETSNNPSLELQNTTTNQNATGFAPGTSNVTALVLNVPLYDGGVSHYQAEQARESVNKLSKDLEQSERDVSLAVDEAFQQMLDRWSAIEVAKENVDQAEEALRVAVLRYQNGISTNVELLDSQAARSQARFGLAQARANYLLSQWTWWQATAGEYPAEVPMPVEIRQRLDEEGLPAGPTDRPLFGPPNQGEKLGPLLPPAPEVPIKGLPQRSDNSSDD